MYVGSVKFTFAFLWEVNRFGLSISGGSMLDQGHPQFLALHPQFCMMQQKMVTMNNITLLCRSKRWRIGTLLAL